MCGINEEDLIINPCNGCLDDENGKCKSKGGCGRMNNNDIKRRCKVCGVNFTLDKVYTNPEYKGLFTDDTVASLKLLKVLSN